MVCCTAVGSVTVVSRVEVVVVVVGSDPHEVKPSMKAVPSKSISIFIVDSFVEDSAQLPRTDVFLSHFFRAGEARVRHSRYRNFAAELTRCVDPIDHFHQLERLFRVVHRQCLSSNRIGKIAQLHFETILAVSRL